MRKKKILLSGLLFCLSSLLLAHPIVQQQQYEIYQFPKNAIPRIDGEFSDWSQVSDSYAIGLKELIDTRFGNGSNLDPNDFNISVKVGWVKGLNRLYFYLEMEDDYWDFKGASLNQDIFELAVDADLSGGNFINEYNDNAKRISVQDLYFKGHGAHAQNYHIFTPVQNKDWAMVWGNTPWIKEFPFANVAYDYNFAPGEKGKLRMEFYITPFDYAAIEGYEFSTPSILKENDLIGLSWSMLDFDGKKCESFMNLAHDNEMISNGSALNLFKLMPLEKKYLKTLEANWSVTEINRNKRWFQFQDSSEGKIEKWHWDFGDGNSSDEQNPSHIYKEAGRWVVILTVEGPEEKSIRSKVWEVVSK